MDADMEDTQHNQQRDSETSSESSASSEPALDTKSVSSANVASESSSSDTDQAGDTRPGTPLRRSVRLTKFSTLLKEFAELERENMGDKPSCRVCYTDCSADELFGCSSCSYASHKACKECLGTFWEMQIYSGKADQLTCIGSDECGKKPNQEDLKKVLNERTLKKYYYFMRKKLLHGKEVIFCSKDMCWEPIFFKDSSKEKESKENKESSSKFPDYYLQCKTCQSYNCKHCGSLISDAELFPDKIHQCKAFKDVQKEERKVKTRAKKVIRSMSHKRRDGGSNATENKPRGMRERVWLLCHAKQCPACGVNIEKNMGCNHMTCASCGFEYCHKCRKAYGDMNHFRNVVRLRQQFIQENKEFGLEGLVEAPSLFAVKTDDNGDSSDMDEELYVAFAEVLDMNVDELKAVVEVQHKFGVCDCAERSDRVGKVVGITVLVVLSPIIIVAIPVIIVFGMVRGFDSDDD